VPARAKEGEFEHSVPKGTGSHRAIVPFRAKHLLGRPAVVPEIRIPDIGIEPQGRRATAPSPLAALRPNAAAGPSTGITSPQATPPAQSPVLGRHSPEVSPTGGMIVVDEDLITSLLGNHQADILTHIENQEARLKKVMTDNLTTKWENFRGTYRTTVKEEVKDAVSALLEDLRKHVNKTVDDRLGARLAAIQGSAAKGLDGSQKEEMSRSLRLEVTNNNAELVRQLGDHMNKEDSGVQKVRRVISSKVKSVTSMLDKQKASTDSLFTKLEDISKEHLTVCQALEQILRPLRENINKLHVEIPLLNEKLINTQDILGRMEGSGPALPLEGDAQVEVCLFTHFI